MYCCEWKPRCHVLRRLTLPNSWYSDFNIYRSILSSEVLLKNLQEKKMQSEYKFLSSNNKVSKTIPPPWRRQLGSDNQLRKKDLGSGREWWCSDHLQTAHLLNRSITGSVFPAVDMASQKTWMGCFSWPLDGHQCRLRVEAPLSVCRSLCLPIAPG